MSPPGIPRAVRLLAALRAEAARRVLALLLLSFGTAMLVVEYVRLPAGEYHPGDIATRDIRASTTFEFVDREQTELRRQQAAEAVLPVYDHDATLGSRLAARIGKAFENARIAWSQAVMAARARGDEAPAPAERSAVALAFLKELQLSLSPEVVDLVADAGWDPRIERMARELVGMAMQSYIVADGTEVPKGVRAITVVRILGDDRRDEVQLTDFGEIVTPAEARQRVSLYALENLSQTADAELVRAAIAIARAAIRPNFSYNQLLTEDRRRAARERVQDVVVRIDRGTVLVREGDVLTEQDVGMIEALREARSGPGTLGLVLALFAFSALAYTAVYLFAAGYIKKFTTRPRDLEALALVTLLVLGLARIVVEVSGPLSGLLGLGTAPSSFWYLVPFAGGAMLVRILVNSETAMVWMAVAASLLGVMLDQQLLFTLFFLVSGVTAAGGIAHTKERVNVLRAGTLAGLVNAAAALLINLVQAYLGESAPATQPLWDVAFAFLGGALGAMLVLGLVPLFELFGFVTDYKLLELSDLNHPLLRQLMLKAPGTYHHSVTVAQLCEAAAEAIGANALLTRVACYFHDIGKSTHPRFFVENQLDGHNPHDHLDPRTSARIVINHVVDGVEIARQHKLPQIVIDGILMHHGTGLIQYFYARAVEEAGGDPSAVDEAEFRYPGVLPDSREMGILMLADKVEAACRTLRDRSPESIRGLIQKLVNSAVLDGQLQRCPLTIRELVTVADSFADTLLSIYHHRVDYPGLPRREGQAASEEPSGPIITLEIPNPLSSGGSGSGGSGDEDGAAEGEGR